MASRYLRARSVFRCIALVGAVLGGLAAGSATAADLPASVKALIPAAEEEGKLLVWGTTLNPRQIADMKKAFNAYYGTDIDLTHQGGRQDIKAQQMALAFKNGAPTGVDVFWSPVPKPLIDASALVAVDWAKEFGVDPSLQIGDYGVETHHSTSLFVTLNSNLVKPGEGPTSYQDLLDPKWRGKIALPRSPFTWFMYTSAYGEDEAAKMLTTLLKDQEVKMVRTHTDALQRVLSGEFMIAVTTDSFTDIAKGAPVRHADLEEVVMNSAGAFILADSPNVNAAKLWIYWAVSPEGQKTLEAVRGYSLVETETSRLFQYAKDRKVHKVPFDWRLENQDRLVPKFAKIIQEAGGSR